MNPLLKKPRSGAPSTAPRRENCVTMGPSILPPCLRVYHPRNPRRNGKHRATQRFYKAYTQFVGFYYGSGAPPPKEKSGSLKEVALITWVVFKTLALPMAVLLGGVILLVGFFYLFSLNPLFGLGGILLIILAVLGRGVWEWRHPPEIR